MLNNPDLLKAFERSQIQQIQPDYFHNLRIFEALYEEAKTLGSFPLKDPLEGIEVQIRLAQVINVHTSPRQTRHRVE